MVGLKVRLGGSNERDFENSHFCKWEKSILHILLHVFGATNRLERVSILINDSELFFMLNITVIQNKFEDRPF